MMLTPLKISGFTGGITDSPIEANPTQYQFADNLLVTKTEQLYTRPGSIPFSIAHTQLPTGNQRVGSVWDFNEGVSLIGQSARRVFYASGAAATNATWTELLGPTGNVCFSAGATTNRVSGSDWKGHLIFTNDGGALPMKIFQDQSSTYQTQTLGLPKFLPANAYSATTVVTAAIRDLANNIRTQMLAHFANTNYSKAHSSDGVAATPDTVSAAIITAPALVAGDSFATASVLVHQLAQSYTNHLSDAVTTQKLRLYHPKTNSAVFPVINFVNPGAPNVGLSFLDTPKTWLALAQQLNEIKRNFNWHVSSFKGHVDTGGPHQPPLVNDRATTADLASTNQGPTFSDLNYSSNSPLVVFANALKTQINAHMADTVFSHPNASAFIGIVDAENQIQMIDATDANSLFELAVHIYSGYAAHQADASLPVYAVTGTTTHPATPRVLGTVSSIYPGFGALPSIGVGMYIASYGGGGGQGDNFPRGTQVVTVTPAAHTLTLSADNSADGTSGDPIYANFSNGRYHYEGQQVPVATAVYDKNFVANAQKGDLNPFPFGFDVAIGDPGSLSGMLSDIALKFNQHDNNYGYTPSAGSTFPSPTLHPNPGGHQVDVSTIPEVQGFSYGYAFCYRYKYQTLSGENFLLRSTPLYKQKKSYYNITDSATTIPDLSTFTNGATNNYDTANIVVEVYRTISAGQVYYYAGSVPLGTVTFKDAVTDSDIIAQAKLYTSGGVLGNDPPPACKVMHITQDGTPFFGGVTNTLDDGSTETVVNRIQQGVTDSPDSAPGSNFVDLPGAVAGISSVRTLPIGFTKNSCHRLEGRFDLQGQGQLNAVTISDRIGLVGPFSPVQIDGAVVFAGPDQFYLTDGYALTPLGKAWSTTYAGIVSGTRGYNIQGTFDKLSNRVWWAATGAGTENDRCFILDLNHPVSPNGCFTTASNGSYFAPTALCTFQGNIIRGDSRGYVFAHNETLTSDPKLDTTGANTTATNWTTRWIPFNYTGPASDFGLSGFRKWCSVIETKFQNLGDASVQINGINDMGRTTGNCFPIRSRGTNSLINERRFFPAGSLYFALKQIQLKNAKVTITNSDTLGTATVTLGTTVTINAGTFPADMVDHVIAFEADGYTAEFTITAQNGANTVLTVVGATNVVGAKWVIRGYPKTERIQLQEYTLWASQMGANQTTATAELGANA